MAVLQAVTKGIFDQLPVENMEEAEQAILQQVSKEIPNLDDILTSDEADDSLWEKLSNLAEQVVKSISTEHGKPGTTEEESTDS